MAESDIWIEAALAPLRAWLTKEPKIERPDDLSRLVNSMVGRAIRADREEMWGKLAGKSVSYRHPSGVSFCVRLGDWMSLQVMQADEDDEALRFALSRLTPGGSFLDIGANTGWFGLRAAKKYREIGGGHVIAFEPQPVMAELIRGSIAENGFEESVTLHQLALGDREDRVWMSTAMNSGGQMIGFEPHAGAFEVQMKPLDQLAIAAERVDFIKLDIEGAEPLFIEGARDFLRQHHPTIYSEVHHVKLEIVSQRSRAGYLDQVEALGYRTAQLTSEGDIIAFDRAELEKAKLLNLVFEPI